MPREIERKRLNYMQAYIKYYDDGSQILQSYNTDVVKRTPDGQYIRLWGSWSATTNKHVHAYCGRSFRSLPFEDGSYEKIDRYKRHGFNCIGSHEYAYSVDECKEKVKRIIEDIKLKDFYHLIVNGYNSACNKELKQWANTKKKKQLVDALYCCATKKPTKNPMGVLAKLYNFDIKEVWKNTLKADWGELEYQGGVRDA